MVIYLETSIEQQLRRVRRGERRPLLAGASDLPGRLTELMALRAPLYREVANITVTTDGHRVRDVVDQILSGLRLG
jgi:shikimate kinase